METLLIYRVIGSLTLFLTCFSVFGQSGDDLSGGKEIKDDAFTIQLSPHGISGLQKTGDQYPTDYVQKGKVFGGIVLRYKVKDQPLDSLKTSDAKRISTVTQSGADWQVEYANEENDTPVRLTEQYELRKNALIWKIKLDNTTAEPISIEDLVLPLSYNNQGGENPKEIFEERVIKHHFISGNNSFLFWQRPTGLGPYLVMVPLPGSSLEYFSTRSAEGGSRGVFQAFIHSAYTGKQETRGTWRQSHTSSTISGNGSKTYGFKFRWATDYEEIRNILIEEGLIDVHVMPGMTIPNDLEANVALRTKQKIHDVLAEHPSATTIEYLGERQKDTHLYKIKFTRLGENKLTVHYGNNYKTYLEFFVTEPLETLYKKRAAFIVNKQQHKDSTKWYDGLFSIWDMKEKVLRGPDDMDGFDESRLIYVPASDDPILGKAPFVAAKNVFYPNQKEIDALEYHIENFVWGGLQRTDKEKPNPYGIYGTPNWLVNRDTVRREQNTHDKNKDKMHVWRSYDYPHVIMMYYHMYQIAKMYPAMTHYLDEEGYLERAKETAKAYFTYPYEILPWYETYKWGCYNELLLVDLIAELEKVGDQEDADWLRQEWEKKVKYFIYDDPYPFRSEYAVDATAYESTHAVAKYAVHNTLQPDTNLWYDKNYDRWYSHPEINPEDAIRFMDKQMQANIASRGWIEPAYYYYGSDFRGRSDSFTLSYMAQMGGWSILDYALHFTDYPADYIRLGYGSYLSSFALINSGTAESNYGYWYPGKENDGAAGWAFEPQKYTITWIQKPQGRGPWYYDGEIDLGFGGATRMAATIVTEDSVFGLVAYGGSLQEGEETFSVIPKDGLRRRFFHRVNDKQLDLELNRDGFAADQPIIYSKALSELNFTIENRTLDVHEIVLYLAGLKKGNYTLEVDGTPVRNIAVDGKKQEISIAINEKATAGITLKRISE